MKAFGRFENEIWRMDLAYVDKLAKSNKGVKYLLVRQDLFDRTVDAKVRKTKDSKETVRAILTIITKKNRPKKIRLTEEQNLLESLKKYAKLKEYKFTLQRVRPRLHLLNVQYDPEKCTLPLHERQRIQAHSQLTQFVTTVNSRRNCSIDLIAKNVKNSNFLPILYSKPPREFRKPNFKNGDIFRTSKYNLPFRKSYKPHFIEEVFEIVVNSSNKPPTYTIKDEQDEFIRGKFYQKELIKVI